MICLDIKEIREYGEEYPVKIRYLTKQDYIVKENPELNSRLVVVALNEGGCNSTMVDLVDLLTFVRTEIPDLWDSIRTK